MPAGAFKKDEGLCCSSLKYYDLVHRVFTIGQKDREASEGF